MQNEVMYTIFIGGFVCNINIHNIYTCICANNITSYEYITLYG